MSKEKIAQGASKDSAVSDLAKAALTGADVTTLDAVSVSSRFERGFFARQSLQDSDLRFIPFHVPDFSNVLCMTDQSHALTVGDMVRRGVQDVGQVNDSDYDFPDGKDDGRNVDQFLSWREPAELSEQEHNILSRMSDNAARKSMLSALEKVASQFDAKSDTQGDIKTSPQTSDKASVSVSQEKKE